MFKAGDKVRCINNSGRAELRKDAIYTIEIPDEFYISLKGFTGKFFSRDRFELVKEESMFKVDDRVTPFLDCAGLTIGDTYTVKKIADGCLYMFDNKGTYDGWLENRFKLVKDDPVVAAWLRSQTNKKILI